MKKINLFICICASLVIFVNASVWEGAAAVAAGDELPDTGLYMATNSFPVNTEVDVTNLDTGKTVRVTALKGLDNPGLLAVLSKDAGSALEFKSGTPGRIRMSQPADPAALSPLAGGRGSSGDPDFDPAVLAAQNGYDSPGSGTGTAGQTADTLRVDASELIVDLPDNFQPFTEPAAAAPAPAAPAAEAVTVQPVTPVASAPSAEPAITEPPPQSAELSLVPAEERPPEAGPTPDSSYILPQTLASASLSDYMDPSLFIAPVEARKNNTANMAQEPPELTTVLPEAVSIQPEAAPVQIFAAPLVNGLEKGSYYLQIAAFSKEESVRTELSKIDNNLPVAIMNAGSAEKPVYRILIGPVNLGESGALLQRFKTTYKDAFVRLGGK